MQRDGSTATKYSGQSWSRTWRHCVVKGKDETGCGDYKLGVVHFIPPHIISFLVAECPIRKTIAVYLKVSTNQFHWAINLKLYTTYCFVTSNEITPALQLFCKNKENKIFHHKHRLQELLEDEMFEHAGVSGLWVTAARAFAARAVLSAIEDSTGNTISSPSDESS